jgi:hypothetical protein
MEAEDKRLTLREWVFLVWNTYSIYDGHAAGEDVHRLLDRIAEQWGLISVEEVFEQYDSPKRGALRDFKLQRRGL